MHIEAQGAVRLSPQAAWRPAVRKARRWTGFAIVLFGVALVGSGATGWISG